MSTSEANDFDISKNGDSLCFGNVQVTNPYGTGYCSTNVELASGDQVYVVGNGNYNGGYCGFSGFMVKAL